MDLLELRVLDQVDLLEHRVLMDLLEHQVLMDLLELRE
jgi:hypothetical protein